MRSGAMPAVFALAAAVLGAALSPGARADEPAAPGETLCKVVVVDVEKPQAVEGRDVVNATLLFDKPVPNGKGTLVVDLAEGRQARVNLLPVDQDPDGKNINLGQPTTRLLVQWAPKKDNLQPNQLKGRPARYLSQEDPSKP
jgi:hypothetical protein